MRQLTLLALNKLYVCTALHIEDKVDLSCLPDANECFARNGGYFSASPAGFLAP